MTAELREQNAVVVAQNVNATIFSQLWLVRNGIVSEDEFNDDCIFTPAVVQVNTRRFSLLIAPDRLQQTIPGANDEPCLAESVLGKIVDILPHTPYKAVGLNFVWRMTNPGWNVSQYTRQWFFAENPISRFFDSGDCKFGAYYSKDVFGGRLRLTVLPVSDTGEQLQLAYNFNVEVLAEDPLAQIHGLLRNWDDAQKLSRRLTEDLDRA